MTNDVVETMEECKEKDRALGAEIRKSIFLCKKKKTSFYLVVLPAGKALDAAVLENKTGISKLSFAPAESMEELLGAHLGSATMMRLVNDGDDCVQLIFDKEIADEEWFGCNSGINTAHLRMKTEDYWEIEWSYINMEICLCRISDIFHLSGRNWNQGEVLSTT